jgi:hypothetical protein
MLTAVMVPLMWSPAPMPPTMPLAVTEALIVRPAETI